MIRGLEQRRRPTPRHPPPDDPNLQRDEKAMRRAKFTKEIGAPCKNLNHPFGISRFSLVFGAAASRLR